MSVVAMCHSTAPGVSHAKCDTGGIGTVPPSEESMEQFADQLMPTLGGAELPSAGLDPPIRSRMSVVAMCHSTAPGVGHAKCDTGGIGTVPPSEESMEQCADQLMPTLGGAELPS